MSFYKKTIVLLALAAFLLGGSVLAADTYKIDPVHSTAVFRVKHFSVSYYNGLFRNVQGSIVFDPANPASSSLNVELKANSVFTNNKQRDGHIKGPDFLNARQFPVLSFKSTRVKEIEKGSYQVSGELTIRGVTKPLTITVEHVGSSAIPNFGYRVGFTTQFTFNRRDFQVNYGTDYVVGDKVQITLDLEAMRQ